MLTAIFGDELLYFGFLGLWDAAESVLQDRCGDLPGGQETFE